MSNALDPQYPDVPLSVALINSNLTLTERAWALQAVTDRQSLRNEIAALKKDLELARAERDRAILETRKETVDKWIKRTDQEPEDNVDVMWCRVPVCEPYVVTCMCSNDWDESFTHWQPLPAPPVGEGEG